MACPSYKLSSIFKFRKKKYRTTSEYNFVIEQSLPVEPVQDLGFLEPGM